MKKLFVTLLAAVLVFLPSVARAGWKITQIDKPCNGKSVTSTLYLDHNVIRSGMSNQDYSIIMNLQNDRLVIISDRQKTYSQLRISEFVAQIRQTVEMIKMVKSQLPPEEAAKLPDISGTFQQIMKPTGKSGVVVGFKASEYEVFDGQQKSMGFVWLSKDGAMGKIQAELLAFGKALGGELSMLAPVLSLIQDAGFPVRMHIMNTSCATDSVVDKLEEIKLDAKLFNVPGGYKEVPFNQFVPESGAGIPNITTIKE